jgi:hypothetical protein
MKRVATASSHNWVVVAVAVCLPFTKTPILALPLLARLHLPGNGQPSCAQVETQQFRKFDAAPSITVDPLSF